MSEQSGTEKGRERLWMCCMGVYCLTLFLVLLGFLLMEYCTEETALELSAYQDLQSSPDIYLVGINSAGAADLQILPRIGPVLAHRLSHAEWAVPLGGTAFGSAWDRRENLGAASAADFS